MNCSCIFLIKRPDSITSLMPRSSVQIVGKTVQSLEVHETMSKYLDIKFLGASERGKTLLWGVYNSRTSEKVGEIRWNGGWRKYIFFEDSGPNQYDADFLRGVADFLDEANKRPQNKAIHKQW